MELLILGGFFWVLLQVLIIFRIKSDISKLLLFITFQLLVISAAGLILYLGSLESGMLAGLGHILVAIGIGIVDLIICTVIYFKENSPSQS